MFEHISGVILFRDWDLGTLPQLDGVQSPWKATGGPNHVKVIWFMLLKRPSGFSCAMISWSFAWNFDMFFSKILISRGEIMYDVQICLEWTHHHKIKSITFLKQNLAVKTLILET